MRTDVKLGVVISMVVVLAAGGYFLIGGKREPAVPVSGGPATADSTAAKPATAKPTTPAKPRQVITNNKDANRNNNVLPATPRENRVATKPADRPAVPSTSTPPGARAAQPQPGNDVALTAPSNIGSEPKPEPKPSAPTVPLPVGLANSSAVPAGTTAPLSLTANNPPATSPAAPVSGADLLAATPPSSSEKVAMNTSPASSNVPVNKSMTTPGSPDLRHAAAPETHKVQPGDSLATLAQTYYGGSKYAKFLADSNPQIADPAKLTPGTTVKIPALPPDIDAKLSAANNAKPSKAAVTTNAAGKRTYKVQPGDSFYRIAKSQLGDANRWKELFNLNKTVVHNDPTQLQVGQTLVLPES